MSQALAIGILGGLGPYASVHLHMLLLQHAAALGADSDQDYPSIIHISPTAIPSRVEFLLGNSDENPLPALYAAISALEAAGATVLAMPCNTAHALMPYLAEHANIPFVHMLDETVAVIAERPEQRWLVMGTSATRHTGIYRERLEAAGKIALVPGEDIEAELMDLIYATKAKGATQEMKDKFAELVRIAGERNGFEGVIVGCTELSMLTDTPTLAGRPAVDALDILAGKTLEAYHAQMREMEARGRREIAGGR